MRQIVSFVKNVCRFGYRLRFGPWHGLGYRYNLAYWSKNTFGHRFGSTILPEDENLHPHGGMQGSSVQPQGQDARIVRLATQHNTTRQRSTPQHNTTTHYSTPHHNTRNTSVTQHNKANTTQHMKIQCNTIHHTIAQYTTGQQSTVHHRTAQHRTAKHSTPPLSLLSLLVAPALVKHQRLNVSLNWKTLVSPDGENNYNWILVLLRLKILLPWGG